MCRYEDQVADRFIRTIHVRKVQQERRVRLLVGPFDHVVAEFFDFGH